MNSTMLKMFWDYCTVFLGSTFGRFISLALSVVIARKLGTENFGRFSLFFTLMMLVWQLINVTDMVYVRFVKNEGQATSVLYIRTCLLLKAWTVLALALAVYPIGEAVSRYIFEKPETLNIILKSTAAGIFLSMFYGVSALFHAREDFKSYAISNSIYYVLLAVSVGILLIAEDQLSVENVQNAYMLPAVVLGIVGVGVLLRKVNYSLEGSGKHLYRVVSFGKWLFAENIIYLILQRIDFLFIMRYATFDEVGIYSVAIRASMIVSMLTSSLSFVLMPKGCESVRTAQARKYIIDSLCAGAVISVGILVTILLCPHIIVLLFGGDYAPAIAPARVLMLEAVFVVMYTPFSYILYAAGESKKIFHVSLVKLMCAIVCLTLLVGKIGAIGAAYAILVSSGVGFIYTLYLSRALLLRSDSSSTV